jgi:hypothetical protein
LGFARIARLDSAGDQPRVGWPEAVGRLAGERSKAETCAGLFKVLETDLEHGAEGLGKFCKMVNDLLPSTSEQKRVVADIVKGAIQPVIDALSDGVAAIYNNSGKEAALTRETIKTQLEATKWPNFSEVKAAK